MSSVVIQTLSADRFSTYLQAAGWDEERALRLYLWNARMGEAFHMPIQAVEVSLRNRINHALVAKFGSHWWASAAFARIADNERAKDIETVLRRISHRKIKLMNGQVVAGLSFGFWVGLLQSRYNPPIWGGRIHGYFPALPGDRGRDDILRRARNVAYLRNRISHHEPIFQRDLLRDFSEIMQLLRWICPQTHDWIRPECKVTAIVRQKP